MSSGLVPITNAVAAIPEFADENCAILAENEDYMGLADGIRKLYHNPELYVKMSENAAKRVRRQTSRQFTILKELDLIGFDATSC
jgi:glycosyltransferase involved in cell wall biosynthesis